ncbi:hypothetical protein ES703_125690 [subsurface metagenome]
MRKKVMVTIKPEYKDNMDEIKIKLLSHNMTIHEAYESGVILGSLEANEIRSVETEPFIEAIEDDEENILPSDRA